MLADNVLLENELRKLSSRLKHSNHSAKKTAISLYLKYNLSELNDVNEVKKRLEELKYSLSSLDVIKPLGSEQNSLLQQCLDLLGESENATTNLPVDYVVELRDRLILLQERMSVIARSKSGRNIFDLLDIVEDSGKYHRLRTDKSINDLLETMLSAFNPEALLKQLEDNETDRKWLEKNKIFCLLKKKHKNIHFYKDSGKFLRDYWILYKLNAREET